MEMEDKTYYQPGDEVTLRQEGLLYKPVMVVKTVDKVSSNGSMPELLGITCMWFSTTMVLQVSRFSTKDLKHVRETR